MAIDGMKVIDLDSHLVGDLENWEQTIEDNWKPHLPKRLPTKENERRKTLVGNRIMVGSELGDQRAEKKAWFKPDDLTPEGRVRNMNLDGIDVAYISASEIVSALNSGRAHLGVTGEDIIRENIVNADERVALLKPLGFGHANVVVAVPACWVDVNAVSDLEAAAVAFRREHGRPFRVATKYINLARRFLSGKGLADYRIVESLGATEGTPAAGLAELIVDITTSGATLKANGLKVLDDGVILKSEANLVASQAAAWTPELAALEARIAARFGCGT